MTDTRSFSAGHHAIAILAMALVVAASNYLVQFPVEHVVGGVNLADTLTWGAFTYPIAFLVTDLTNRHLGVLRARQVVLVGFALAVALSVWLATPRIAIASGTSRSQNESTAAPRRSQTTAPRNWLKKIRK